MKNPIMLALDVDTDVQAFKLLDQIGDQVGAVKIGPRLNLKYGSEFVKKITNYAPVFIDNKYFDITSTVLAAIQTSFESGASFVTVHATNGLETLKAIAILEKKLNETRPFKILAVTVLTSWDQQNLPPVFINQTIEQHVLSLANLTLQAGLGGIVCSGHELSSLKNDNLFKVVPGVRVEEDLVLNTQDQKRIMTPAQAIQAGASALVIGRSILNSNDPKLAVKKILDNIQL